MASNVPYNVLYDLVNSYNNISNTFEYFAIRY